MSPPAATKKNREFDSDTFLATIGDGRKILSVSKKQVIFAQGDAADAVFYVQKGKVRLTVVSQAGKEATIAIVSEGNFFGEGRKILSVSKKQVIFAQGDAADAVFYVQKGKVRLTVVSQAGKEATIAIVSEGNFFGEGSL